MPVLTRVCNSTRLWVNSFTDNRFIQRHHHVESIHFTTRYDHALHPALAVVQTPGREYFILKDNGMQVGCEEEGVGLVWMGLLRCTSAGCPKL